MDGMEKTLIEQLSKDMPIIGSSDRSDLIKVILGQSIQRPVNELTAALVDSGVEIGDLLSALLRCEWQSVQHLMQQADASNMNARLVALSRCTEHFNELQASILSAYDCKWHAALDGEVHKRVLAECKAMWKEEGIVHLHNYFHEMPVTVKAKYLAVSDVNLSVAVSPKIGWVFAVSDDMREALVTSPDANHIIRLGVISCMGNTLKLVVHSVEEARCELRHHVRLEVAGEVQLHLSSHNISITALMHDLSAAGLGLSMPADAILQPGEELTCIWHLGGRKISLEAITCWVDVQGTSCRAGLKFKSLGPFADVIHKFMLAGQQQLISRIKKLAVPNWMRNK